MDQRERKEMGVVLEVLSSAAGSWGFVHESQHCKIKIVKLPTAGDIAQQSMVWSPVPSCLKAAEKQAPKMD